ncbi:endo-1,4-beta-xylanase [Clostridium akagii]|uniref:endo-1,4-beta-xylanase n=1 Tax=Clostridium akagii TaxID=91623 RepID=UPI00047EE6D1|nr:endo-1,4-beta-xylanase [Clostridium akagii]
MKKSLKHLLMAMLTITIFISSFGTIQVKAATSDQTLLNTYGSKLGRVGTCVSLSQLQNSATLSVIKQRYNSITLENEMKPDALLGSSPTLLTVSQAKALGYYIPSNYTESTVPSINFATIDKVLQICYNNGLGVRGHTLVWQSQTPSWLFNTNYSSSGNYVSSTVMDARMEFYIKTVMNHVFSSKYGSVVYAWDVVNEYLHSPSTSGWVHIYGNVSDSPQFVKNAFRYAYEAKSSFGLTSKVSLFYNDYNEYMESSDIIKMINYINSGTRYCSGIGCQSHLSSSFPSAASYKLALQAFVNAGLEIQITELDAGANSETEQASYLYSIMKSICEVKQAGGNITGITWWGLSDDLSWRQQDHPLLFSTLYAPKASYYKTLDAFTDVFN